MAAKACGKFILGGEHSVVYRGRALAFPLPKLELHYREHRNAQKKLILNGKIESESRLDRLLQLRSALGIESSCPGIEIKSDIPLGAGLGSSAALCVAMLRAHFPALSGTELAQRALIGERLFHGKPSGVDPYTVALEQAIAFRAQDASVQTLDTRSFREAQLCFVLKDSGTRHETLNVVSQVQKVKEETPLIWDDLMDALATNAQAMIEAFEKRPATALGRLMNDSHFRLIQLGVSNETIDDIADEFRKAGALGAKITGAGQGGFVLGLFYESALPSLGEDLLVWRAG